MDFEKERCSVSHTAAGSADNSRNFAARIDGRTEFLCALKRGVIGAGRCCEYQEAGCPLAKDCQYAAPAREAIAKSMAELAKELARIRGSAAVPRKPCTVCGNPVRHSHHTTCSIRCRDELRARRESFGPSPTNPITVLCPTCGAQPGERCHTVGGTHSAGAHNQRVIAAREAA